MFAKNLKPSTSRTCESNKLQKTGGGGKGGGNIGSGEDKPWKNDYSVWVPKKARRAREIQALQLNYLQNTQPQVPTTPGTTMVTFAPGTQVMKLDSAGISNGKNNQSGGTPTIHEIMASQT
eukprot:5895434-Ditylum_brightwellii.AAC.2